VFHNIKIKTIDLQRLVKMPAALFFEIHSGNEFFFCHIENIFNMAKKKFITRMNLEK